MNMSIRSRFRILITLLYGVSENPEEKNSAEELFAAYFSDMLEAGFQVDSGASLKTHQQAIFPA